MAEAVLARPNSRLEVVTPFSLAEYRKDFELAHDHAEFERLLGRAARFHELDGSPRHPISKAARAMAYLRGGKRVVDSCEIVVAIWNGRRAAGVGGTADIVQYAIEHDRIVLWIDSDQPDRPPRIVRSFESVVVADDLPQMAGALSRGYAQQVAYSTDASIPPDDLATKLRALEEPLRRAAETRGLTGAALDGVVSTILPQFVRADTLAAVYQHKHSRAVNGVLYLAALAVTVALVQVLFFPEQLWIIGFEIAAMVGVFGLWLSGRRQAWHEKWLRYRYLAERLRIATFTALLGSRRQEAVADPLPFYRGPQEWLSHTVDALVTTASRSVAALPLDPLKAFVRDAWLAEQQTFHRRNASQKTRSARRRHVLGLALFGATLVMALLHLLGVGHYSEAQPLVLRPGLWITFLALVLPVWAGAVHAVTSQLELERVAARSGRMAHALEPLVDRLVYAENHDAVRDVLDATADLMMIETHEWWVLLSFQDIRLQV